MNYRGSVIAFLFLINRHIVLLEKTVHFLSELTEGGNCACRWGYQRPPQWIFSEDHAEQNLLFQSLLDGPMMYVGGTVAKVNK